MPARSMTEGVGLYRKLIAKDPSSVPQLLQTIEEHCADATPTSPQRSTVVWGGSTVVLVEEWASQNGYIEYEKTNTLASNLSPFVRTQSAEYFPQALHISNAIDPTTETVGILVRQKTSSTVNGGKLRDAQREAYERQMTHEPGCTGCIILAGSNEDDAQVRIVELWKTMDDFYFHESSDWHARGEEKVVPLVVDMDCDFVRGRQFLQGD